MKAQVVRVGNDNPRAGDNRIAFEYELRDDADVLLCSDYLVIILKDGETFEDIEPYVNDFLDLEIECWVADDERFRQHRLRQGQRLRPDAPEPKVRVRKFPTRSMTADEAVARRISREGNGIPWVAPAEPIRLRQRDA